MDSNLRNINLMTVLDSAFHVWLIQGFIFQYLCCYGIIYHSHVIMIMNIH